MQKEEPCHLCGRSRPSYVEMEVQGARKSICERCYKTKVAVPREPVDDEAAEPVPDEPATARGPDADEMRRRAIQTIPPTAATRRNEALARAAQGGSPEAAAEPAPPVPEIAGKPPLAPRGRGDGTREGGAGGEGARAAHAGRRAEERGKRADAGRGALGARWQGKACRSCDASLSHEDAFCHSCGEPTASFCGMCGRRLDPGDRFCPGCGAKA